MRGDVRIVAGLAAPYLAQGLAYGFMGWVVVPTLAARGVPLADQAWVLAAGGLPWVAKAAFGPWLDRHRRGSGQRPDPRRSVALASVVAAGCAALLGTAAASDHGSAVAVLAVLWLVHNVALALQDAATDALVLDVVPPARRGRVAAALLSAHHVGAEAIAGMLLGAAVGAAGLGTGAWIEAAVVLLLGLATLAVPWSPGSSSEGTAPAPGPRLGAFLRRRETWILIAVAALLFAGDQVTSAASATFLVGHLGWSPEELQRWLAPLALVAALAGYAVAFATSDRQGHVHAVVVGGVGLATVWLAFAAASPWWTLAALVAGMVFLQGIATSVFYVGAHAGLMDATPPEHRATAYVLFMAALNLPRAYAPHLAAPAVAALGYAGTFAACGAVQVLTTLAFGWAIRRTAGQPSRKSTSPNDQ